MREHECTCMAAKERGFGKHHSVSFEQVHPVCKTDSHARTPTPTHRTYPHPQASDDHNSQKLPFAPSEYPCWLLHHPLHLHHHSPNKHPNVRSHQFLKNKHYCNTLQHILLRTPTGLLIFSINVHTFCLYVDALGTLLDLESQRTPFVLLMAVEALVGDTRKR